MSKELLVAGAIVVVCLGVTAIALSKPAKPKAETIEVAQTDADGSSQLDPYVPSAPMTPMDSFGRDGLSAPPGTADLNPNRPFDNLGTPDQAPLGTLPPTAANPFPGASSQSPGGVVETTPATTDLEPAAPLVPEISAEQIHVIKRGDTLAEISKRYYGTTKHWQKIKEANRVDPDGLQEGAKLTIPALAGGTASVTSAPAVGEGAAYVVKKGDNYYKIAKRELGDASRAKEIEKLNQIPAADLRPGMKLALPARGSREAAIAPEAPASADGRVHTVGKDEYLTDISKQYYGSTKHWRTIEKANPGIDPDRLKVGQKLVIPELAGASRGTTQPAAGEGEYVVVAGDTFEAIAGKVLGDRKQFKRIAEANPGVDASRLRIGQKLKLPAGSDTGSVVPAINPLTPVVPPAPSTPLEPTPSFPIPGPTIPSPTTTPGADAPLPPSSDPWNLGAPGPGASTETPMVVPTNPWADVDGPAGGTSSPAP